MLEVYRLFALHCLLISGLTSVLYLCSASFFLSLQVSFPQCWRFQGDPSTIAHLSSVVAWMWSRTWRTVLVNGFCYPEPFKRLKKNVHWHSLDLLWLVDNRYTVLFWNCLNRVFRFSMFWPFFWLFPYTFAQYRVRLQQSRGPAILTPAAFWRDFESHLWPTWLLNQQPSMSRARVPNHETTSGPHLIIWITDTCPHPYSHGTAHSNILLYKESL